MQHRWNACVRDSLVTLKCILSVWVRAEWDLPPIESKILTSDRVGIHVSPKLDFLLRYSRTRSQNSAKNKRALYRAPYCTSTPPPPSACFIAYRMLITLFSVGYVYLRPRFCVFLRHFLDSTWKGTFYLHSGKMSKTHPCLFFCSAVSL